MPAGSLNIWARPAGLWQFQQTKSQGATKLSRIQALNGAGPSMLAPPPTARSKRSREILVNAPSGRQGRDGIGTSGIVVKFRPRSGAFKEMLHQWAKNALVFVPLFTSHSYRDPHLLGWRLAFLAFGLRLALFSTTG